MFPAPLTGGSEYKSVASCRGEGLGSGKQRGLRLCQVAADLRLPRWSFASSAGRASWEGVFLDPCSTLPSQGVMLSISEKWGRGQPAPAVLRVGGRRVVLGELSRGLSCDGLDGVSHRHERPSKDCMPVAVGGKAHYALFPLSPFSSRSSWVRTLGTRQPWLMKRKLSDCHLSWLKDLLCL